MILFPKYLIIFEATQSDTNTFLNLDLDQYLSWNVFHCALKELSVQTWTESSNTFSGSLTQSSYILLDYLVNETM